MSIEQIQRKRGIGYRVRVMRDGQKFTETFNRRYDAEQFQKKAEEGGHLLVETDLTFEKAAEQWTKNHAEVHKSPAGISSDRRMLEKNILPLLGRWKLKRINVRQIEDLIGALRSRGMANTRSGAIWTW